MTRGPQASCLSHEPAAPLKSEESTPGQHPILYPSVFDQKKKGKKLSLRKTYTALPNPQDTQTLVFSPFRRAISLHHPIPQKANLGNEKASSSPPPPGRVSRPPPPSPERRWGDWASSSHEGRPRGWRWWRRQEEPRHARSLSTPTARPQTPKASAQRREAPEGDESGTSAAQGFQSRPRARGGAAPGRRGAEGVTPKPALLWGSREARRPQGHRARGRTQRAQAAGTGTPPPTAHLHAGESGRALKGAAMA